MAGTGGFCPVTLSWLSDGEGGILPPLWLPSEGGWFLSEGAIEGGWFLTEGRNSEVTGFVWDDGAVWRVLGCNF